MSMVMDRSTSIEEFPEIKSGGKDVSTPLLRLHVVVSYVMALLRAVVACVQGQPIISTGRSLSLDSKYSS